MTRLILGHLAAAGLVACNAKQPTEPITVPVPEPTPTATAIAPPDRSAPVPTPAPSAPLAEGECREDLDCGPERFCELNFTGAEFTDDPGHCVDEAPIYEGRPLVVDGSARVAPLSEPLASSGWGADTVARDAPVDAAWAELFRKAAAEEHASIAAFARTICQLLALGAPAALVEATQRALADEIDHARRCATWARRLGASSTEPGPLPEAVAPISARAEDLLDEVLTGGCIGETLAAHRMAERAMVATDPELGRDLKRIADDEARHAALAFRTLHWLITQKPSLTNRVHSGRQRFEKQATATHREHLAPLWSTLGV